MVGISALIPERAMEIIQQMMDYIKGLETKIQQLQDEIARLKQMPVKPDIKKTQTKKIMNPGPLGESK